MVYKYFSELSDADHENYQCGANIQEDAHLVQERGNVLGVSTPNLNNWVRQILQTGTIDPNNA